MWSSGNLLTFQQADVTVRLRENVPAGDAFNPAAFQVPAAYTPRTNPWYYDEFSRPPLLAIRLDLGQILSDHRAHFS